MKNKKKRIAFLVLIGLVAGGTAYAGGKALIEQQMQSNVNDVEIVAEEYEKEQTESVDVEEPTPEEELVQADEAQEQETEQTKAKQMAAIEVGGVIPDDLPAKSLADDAANKNPDQADEEQKIDDQKQESKEDQIDKKTEADEKSEVDEESDGGTVSFDEDPEDDQNETDDSNAEKDDSQQENNQDPNVNDPSVNEPTADDTNKSALDKELADFPAYDAQAGIPYAYSSTLHGNVTPVKTQQGNMCWAFAATAAAESSLLAQNEKINGIEVSAETLDLSEMQLAYFFYHSVADEYGNTAGDTTTVAEGAGNYISVGGNSIFTTFALANWTGMVEESLMPLLYDLSKVYDPALAWSQDQVHLQNAYWIAYEDTEEMKQAIIDYGGVAFNYYYSSASSYYNSQTAAYYYSGRASVNHASEIIGWDDTYSADNFTIDPGRDGAWLVKNSYGTSLGIDGYMWISYADAAFLNTTYKAYVFDMEAVDEKEHIYQYDGSNGYRRLNVASGSQVANIFTASDMVSILQKGNGTAVESGSVSKNQSTQNEIVTADETQKSLKSTSFINKATSRTQKIHAVSLALYDTYVNYSVQIYKDLSDENDPLSGTPCLDTPVTGQTSFVGYYKIPLTEPAVVDAGEKYAVVVTLSKNDGSAISVFADASYTNGGWVTFYDHTEAGQSFLKTPSGDWDDLHDGISGQSATSYTIRLKAFAID